MSTVSSDDAAAVADMSAHAGMIQRKPGVLRNGAHSIETADAFRQLQARLLQPPGSDREMVDNGCRYLIDVLASKLLKSNVAIPEISTVTIRAAAVSNNARKCWLDLMAMI